MDLMTAIGRPNTWYEPDESKEYRVELVLSKEETIVVHADNEEQAYEIAREEISYDYEVIDSSVRRVG